MNFRTVVQDGLIVVNTHGALPDGTRVDISVAKSSKTDAGRRSANKPQKRATTGAAHAPGFGMWADREDLASSEKALDALRSLTRRRRVD